MCYFLICMYRAVTRYLCTVDMLLHRTTCQCVKFLDIILGHGCNNISRKANSSMRFKFPIGHCHLMSVETFPISINISPSLLKELPDYNELACVEALWDKGSCGLKSSIS